VGLNELGHFCHNSNNLVINQKKRNLDFCRFEYTTPGLDMPYKTWASPFAVVAHITAGSSSSHIGGQNCCYQSFFSCFFFIITNGNIFKVLFAKRHDNFKKQGIKRKLLSEIEDSG